jgi:NAD+ synthase (glutamine-hydrolysing)
MGGGLLDGGVRLHQITVTQGNPLANRAAVLACLAQDKADGVKLAVFPEWCIGGALAPSEWLNPALGAACDEALEQIVAATEGIAVLLGTSVLWHGRRVSAVVAAENGKRVFPEGSPLPFVPKLLSPFNRLDALAAGPGALDIAYAEGVAVEDFFVPFRFTAYTVGAWCGVAVPDIGRAFLSRGAKVLIRLDTLTYERNRPAGAAFPTPNLDSVAEGRPEAFFALPVLRCCPVGVVDAGKTVFILEGGTGWMYPNGVRRVAPYLAEAALDWGDGMGTEAPPKEAGTAWVVRALEYGLAAELRRLGLKRIVIGASGGIDSALSAALYSRVVGPDNLLLVNMPSRHNSQTTIGLAKKLADAIGCRYADVPIEESISLTLRQTEGVGFKLTPFAVENVQARDRSGRILSALASAFGGVFTCNANKSECTIGYGTMYGDISGFFAALADLWKIEIWETARYYNREVFGREVIPQGSIDIVPSAELSPAQNVDEGKGDPLVYPWHDRLFAAWTERDEPVGLAQLRGWYHDGSIGRELGYAGDVRELFATEEAFARDIEHFWQLYSGLARAKRLQAPPVLSLKNRTFGFDLGAAQLHVL